LATLEATSGEVLARPDLDAQRREEVMRVEVLGLPWDVGVAIHEPAQMATGADGRKIGIFLLHGGDGDFTEMEPMAALYSRKFGHKVVSMTYPGRLYFDDPHHRWPGDTIHPDGSVRTPIWLRGETITPDQYDVVQDASLRARYGIRTVARAKPGTTFYHRMAAWPMAFEEAMKAVLAKHLPETDYSIYGSGHSTGGPLIFMICQRVPNFAGVIAAEHSPFGFIQARQHDWSGALGKIEGFDRVASTPTPRTDPFNDLYIRTWRDIARYRGSEALGREGATALMRLPSLMEEILDEWQLERTRPQFKAEYIITHDIAASLEAAANANADRLALSAAERAALVAHFRAYPHALSASDARPIPNVLFAIARYSRDHSREVYSEVILPMFSRLERPPRVALTSFEAGTHFYFRAEPGLPLGIGPAVAKLFHEAISEGYFIQ
jgi:hypothetical protein